MFAGLTWFCWVHAAAELLVVASLLRHFALRAVDDLGAKKHLGFAWHFFAPKSSTGEMRVVALKALLVAVKALWVAVKALGLPLRPVWLR